MRVTTHPGEVLREEFMLPLGLSANALSRELHVHSQPDHRHHRRS
jgi:antitoxin HigA-1